MDFSSSFAISVSKVASWAFLSIYVRRDYHRVTICPSGGAFFLTVSFRLFPTFWNLFEGFSLGKRRFGILVMGYMLFWQLCVTSLNHDLIYNKVMHIIGSGCASIIVSVQSIILTVKVVLLLSFFL